MNPTVIISGFLLLASCVKCDTEGSGGNVLLLLNQNLLRSLEGQSGLPNPSVHLALRLSGTHNLATESLYLNRIKNELHQDIQSRLSSLKAVAGRLALYTLALKASCYDLSTVTFSVGDRRESLLTHLKKQMEDEKEHVTHSHRPLTNYYQYSLGVLALCVSGVRLNVHVSNKLIRAVAHERFNHGESESVDTYAMAGMALQCVKDSGLYQETSELHAALSKIKLKLLASQRQDGHIGNEFSTGLAVQALLAMGHLLAEDSAAVEAMRTAVKDNKYHNPMAMSQVLPALQLKSYLSVKNKDCLNEDDTLVLEPLDPVLRLPVLSTVAVTVEVVLSSGASALYSLAVPQGSSVLDALHLLQGKDAGFKFQTESSLWGPFLSVVNGEMARQSDRRYWRVSSDGVGLNQSVGDFKIEAAQRITIENTTY
ncbi:transcobalamin-2 [Synchiropus splendidus]|uniref:transcobalamin-2 n=1 Tax=Synchiropus splendidus TaxID=270530 RepID=UPI00237EBF6E|nr:transcobalamin-2 [Synchiropus splendidus]XP_053726077.1 transcobalamin-2 [Synchiropus splendidus]